MRNFIFILILSGVINGYGDEVKRLEPVMGGIVRSDLKGDVKINRKMATIMVRGSNSVDKVKIEKKMECKLYKTGISTVKLVETPYGMLLVSNTNRVKRMDLGGIELKVGDLKGIHNKAFKK